MLRVSDCITDRVWLAIPQPTEWQRIGNQINAAMIFARSDFVKPPSRIVAVVALFRESQDTHGKRLIRNSHSETIAPRNCRLVIDHHVEIGRAHV